MLLGQLEKMDGDVSGKNVDTTRQVTAKILHLIQTQGKQSKTKQKKYPKTKQKLKNSEKRLAHKKLISVPLVLVVHFFWEL